MSNNDHYHDDPILEVPIKKALNRNRAFGLILSFVAAGVFINSTFAGNISLNSGGSVEFGQGVLAATACDGNFTIKPKADYSNSAGNFKVASIEITGLDSTSNGCAGYGTSSTSLTLTLTSPAIVSTSIFKFTVESTVSSCATGGVCNVGDTGPGGGIVFYKAVSAFACGPTRSNSCYYLEAAPATWSGGADSALSISWSGNTTQSVGSSGGDASTATAIGWGYRNTLAAVAQDSTANKVITRARAYNGAGLNDWFVPSKDELAQLYASRAIVPGLKSGSYWSSSEVSATNIWEQDFSNGNQWSNGKGGGDTVRPIRAF